MRKLSLLLGLLISITTFAQIPSNSNPKTGEINGKILDAQTKTALPYVSIVIKDGLNKAVTGGITDENGDFTIKQISEGENTIEIQFIGYKTEIKKIKITRSNYKIDLGTILLTEEAAQLNEVLVVAETSTVTQKIDRKVINVGKDLTATGSTASELLNNVQSVSVDSQTGNISLRGNDNVRVLIDGKPSNISTAQLLKQIPSSSIKSVELITNPSAKYNPEGMSGIINIVLHKNANLGFNGSVNTGLTIGDNTRYNGSLDVNLKTGKVNIFANYGTNNGKYSNNGTIERFDNNSSQTFNNINKNESHLIKTGLDYYLNEKNTISFFTTQNIYDGSGTGNTQVIYNNNDFDNIIQDFSPKSDNKSQTYNLNYKIEFNKEGHNLELETNYETSQNDENSVYNTYTGTPANFSSYTDKSNNKATSTTINLDYVNPISETIKLELGAEVRINNTDNIYQSTFFANSDYEYNRTINSLYATYSQKFDKLSLQLGARLEIFNVDAVQENTKIYEDDYVTLYPSAFLTYNPSEKNQYQLSYSRRVDRPNLQQVNPIREWSTPTVSSFGNPELKPQFTNSFEVNYTKQVNKGSFTIGTFYRNINDNITRVLFEDPSDVNRVILSFDNTEDNNSYGLEISSNYKLTNWWSANASFDLYNQKDKGVVGNENIEVNSTIWNARINNNYKVSENLRLQLFGMYRGSQESIQWNVKPMWKLDFGASLNVLDNKGTISARISDIFNTMSFNFESEKPYPQAGEFFWESQNAYIGFNYRFGGGKSKARARKSRDNNEAQGGGGFL
jgi:outer membrane receptor protein involved in Fe transport